MTNKIALGLAIFICGVIAVDYLSFGPGHLVFLGQRMLELTEYVAFWR